MALKNCPVGPLMAVSDLARARHFYEDQLGLEPGEVQPESVRYFCAAGTNLFIYLQPDNAGMSAATLAGWTVDDLDSTIDELTARGVRFERYDHPGITTDGRGIFDAGDFRAAWVKDPDGNTMALTQFTP
jgi:catechol 2,3-dioxygenase-like lactoylglutathione lyase family enzyme